jgi:hypothetical protein
MRRGYGRLRGVNHHYALEVHFGDDEPTVRIQLPGHDADDAEVARQTLLRDVEHALQIEAPLIYSAATEDDPQAGQPIDPTKVTSVDLVEPHRPMPG